MDIFYINLSTFDKDLLEQFYKTHNDGRIYKNEKLRIQHIAGLYLVYFIAKKHFNINDTEIIYKNEKPFLKNSELYFSVSHSKDIVAVVFSDVLIGLDVEYNKKKRNFTAILNKCGEEIANYDSLSEEEQQESFYDKWTQYEAKIKLGSFDNEIFYATAVLDYDYTISVATLKTAFIEKLIDINA